MKDLTKSEKAKVERKPRKRLGEWTRAQRTIEQPGIGVIPYTVVVVTYRGRTWERPDTPEGRAEVTRAIQAVNDRARRREQVVRLRAKVAQLVEVWGDGDVEREGLANAADQLANVATLMEANDQGTP
jgi:hypothetical protein